jgi:hypothetical protein
MKACVCVHVCNPAVGTITRYSINAALIVTYG